MQLRPTDRRAQLKASPLAAAGLLLPGCATTMAATHRTCLPAVKVSEKRYAFTGDAGYMFPRPDGIILGGTFEHDISSTQPDPETIARILESQRALFAGFRCVHPA